LGRWLLLYDTLVWTVLSYGVKIWGWKEWKGVEKLEERFLRWVLRVDPRISGYSKGRDAEG